MNEKNIKESRPAQKYSLFAIKVVIALGLMYFLFNSGRIDFSAVAQAYRYPQYLAAGVFSGVLALILPILRWWMLARLQKLILGFFDAVRLSMIGNFFNLFIPGGSGGDVVRAAYAVRDCQDRKAHALTIAFMDRGLGLHALLLTAVVMFFLKAEFISGFPALRPWFMLLSLILFIGTAIPLLLIWERTNGLMMRLLGRMIGGQQAWLEAMRLYRKHWDVVGLCYLLSLVILLVNVLSIHFMMKAVGSMPTLKDSLIVVPLVILANTIPLTPGGIGMAESASAGFYELLGQAGGANGMLLARCLMISFSLCGLPFFLMDRRLRQFNKTITE